MATTYYEKLRDPRWQRKRLQIMERDRWACTMCGSNASTLNVHHGYYERGIDPWDYDDASLTTLCENCHVFMGRKLAVIHRRIASLNSDQLVELDMLLEDVASYSERLSARGGRCRTLRELFALYLANWRMTPSIFGTDSHHWFII